MDYTATGEPEDYTEWVDRTNKRMVKVPAPDRPFLSALQKPPNNSGLRYDDGKPRFDLVPPEAMIALAAHYERGARKYADRNWEKGMAWGKCFASMQRHAWAWSNGEDIDAETDTHHMIAVAWNALALYTYAMRKIGTDDRAVKNAD